MTEQEWLEGMADQWIRNGAITPAFSLDLPVVSECGCRRVLPPVWTPCSMLERLQYADEVEFYAVFDGREVTTRRRISDMMMQSV